MLFSANFPRLLNVIENDYMVLVVKLIHGTGTGRNFFKSC